MLSRSQGGVFGVIAYFILFLVYLGFSLTWSKDRLGAPGSLHQVTELKMVEFVARGEKKMGRLGRLSSVAAAVAILGIIGCLSKRYGWDKDVALQAFRDLSERLGFWAIPLYVLIHTVTLALCLPYAVFLEAAASLLFGFLPAVLCVFSAKVLGASLSFWIGRLVFRSSSSATGWVQGNKYFYVLSRGVERDGWRFVLLARFSPMPSYVINYALAATNVGFVGDFLLPTVIGCLPMILQNISIGSLAGAAVASASGSQESQVLSYLLPTLGIVSSVLISLKIKKYSTEFSIRESSSGEDTHDPAITSGSFQNSLPKKASGDFKEKQ